MTEFVYRVRWSDSEGSAVEDSAALSVWRERVRSGEVPAKAQYYDEAAGQWCALEALLEGGAEAPPEEASDRALYWRPFLIACLLIVLGAGLWFAGGYHYVQTKEGLKVYPKAHWGFSKVYVDMREVSVFELGKHFELVRLMVRSGDLALVPGGSLLLELDRYYQVSETVEEVGTVAGEVLTLVAKELEAAGITRESIELLLEEVRHFKRALED